MRSKDIQPGMRVAIKRRFDEACEAIVLESGWGERSRYGSGPRFLQPGPNIAVAILGDALDPEDHCTPEVVRPAEILGTWEAYCAAQERERVRRAEERERREKHAQGIMERYKAVASEFARIGVTLTLEQGARTSLSLAAAEKIAEMLNREARREQG